ncbi:Alpha-glucosidase [Reticulomyxa filosa]|uniref:Alpha-glucosidase n=1 Tax=Reticulomyxa filosa TaxID=46433 RepID=X6MFM7_RETFI|nr:Alpha-glucosidase [Reticulomyxa filosa]|eukprot:ETO11840.1 Alpha-glucosidase [Reticulomyxa filosa]
MPFGWMLLNLKVPFFFLKKKSIYMPHVQSFFFLIKKKDYPQINQTLNMSQTTGRQLANTYSLFVNRALTDRLHIDQPHKRVFHLSRSSFPGQQATGGAVWSGDISASNDVLRRQIAASLNFQLSGLPYWSEDIGGFFRPADQYTNPWYHRLLIRWFQFGAFTPIFRVHGSESHTEYWNYGPTVLKDVLLIDNLRYRLLPYLYSLAYFTAVDGYTIQRHLVLDYPDVPQVWNIADEFMFGPFILVRPVWDDINTTTVYLPRANGETWWDFWTGIEYVGDQYLYNISVPLDQISLFVKSGGILIFGPFVQWTTQLPWYVLEIRIYRGMDGYFVLYEDNGLDRLSIENNKYSTIVFQWLDDSKTLSISQRVGSFPGMITVVRQFNIVLVASNHGVGVNDTTLPDKVVFYTGSAVQVNF